MPKMNTQIGREVCYQQFSLGTVGAVVDSLRGDRLARTTEN